jgi:anti-sigma regulatory factor (Ser/Thr protein kinase)
LPLGIQGDQQYSQQSFRFEPGDTFLFYSDGVTENRNADGEFFGDDRLIEFVETWSSLGPDALIGRLRRDAKEFCGRDTFSDDFTCIAARIGLSEGEPLQILQADFACEVSELERSRDWLVESASAVPGGLGEDGVIRLQLACGEAIDNCIIHGSKSLCEAPVRVKCCIYPNSLTVDIQHHGKAYDPFAVPPPSFDGSRDNGFGLYIISRSADELAYRREADGTNVVSISIVRKRIDEPNAHNN